VHSPGGWTYYDFDARGAVVRRHLPNDTCTYYAYDAAGRVTAIADRKSSGAVICSFGFERDPNGNITSSLREDGSCWYYEYDGMQRLTGAAWKDGATSLYAYEYGYDRVGNRVSLVYNGEVTYYSYNPANELTHEVTLGGDTVYYSYDGRGNQTERSVLGGETLYFEYDSRNLVTRIDSTEDGFTPNAFGYSALGQRIRKTDSTGTTYYVWDGLNITHEHDGSGTVTRRYTHGHTPTHGVFSLISVADELGCPCFYHLDQVGGVRRLTDAYENVIQTLELSPFGRMLEESGSAPNDLTFPATYLELHDLTALRLSPTRPYDATTGRFTGRDRFLGGVPSYVGLGGNALNGFDSDGTAWWNPLDWMPKSMAQPRNPRDWSLADAAANALYGARGETPSEQQLAAYRGFRTEFLENLLADLVRVFLAGDLFVACKCKQIDAAGFSVAVNFAIIAGPGGSSATGGLQFLVSCHTTEACLFGYAGVGGGVGVPGVSVTGQVSRVVVWGTGRDLASNYRGAFIEVQGQAAADVLATGGGHTSYFRNPEGSVQGITSGVQAGVGSPSPIRVGPGGLIGLSACLTAEIQHFSDLVCVHIPSLA